MTTDADEVFRIQLPAPEDAVKSMESVLDANEADDGPGCWFCLTIDGEPHSEQCEGRRPRNPRGEGGRR